MISTPRLTLNDGLHMPQLGYGLWRVADDVAEASVKTALAAGYRLIDTAKIYENEEPVGRALACGTVAREDIFLTTKLWNADQGFDETLRAFDASAARLGVAYVDLYLIHWPAPSRDQYAASWKALQRLKADGRVKSIGVSNFGIDHLQRIIDESGEVPSVNQIELHPRFAQRELRAFHAKQGIVTESWSPIGQGKLLDEPAIVAIAGKLGKSPAQIILRWHMEHGLIAIPKSVHPQRIADNIEIFNFSLDAGDMTALDAMDSPEGRIGPNPYTAAF